MSGSGSPSRTEASAVVGDDKAQLSAAMLDFTALQRGPKGVETEPPSITLRMTRVDEPGPEYATRLGAGHVTTQYVGIERVAALAKCPQ